MLDQPAFFRVGFVLRHVGPHDLEAEVFDALLVRVATDEALGVHEMLLPPFLRDPPWSALTSHARNDKEGGCGIVHSNMP